MTYKEAIELIRKCEFGCANSEEISLIAKAHKVILDHYDKDRWHDLLEVPDDLPIEERTVL